MCLCMLNIIAAWMKQMKQSAQPPITHWRLETRKLIKENDLKRIVYVTDATLSVLR